MRRDWYHQVILSRIVMARTTATLTISLPPAMLEELKRVRKHEHRTRSELMREALRSYFSNRISEEEVPTTAELRTIRRGRATIAYRLSFRTPRCQDANCAL